MKKWMICFGLMGHLIVTNSFGQEVEAPIPSMTRVLEIPNTGESLFVDANNDSNDDEKIFYYFPQRVDLDKIDDKSVFSYAPLPGNRGKVQFRMSQKPSIYVEQHRDEITSWLADFSQADAKKIRLASLPLLRVNFSTLHASEQDERFEHVILPPDNILVGSSMAFYFRLSRLGSGWFKNEIIEDHFNFASLRAEVPLYDEITEEVLYQRISIPLYLDTVPKCAVTALGCDFQW